MTDQKRDYTAKRRSEISAAWKRLAQTIDGQLVIADLMVWGNVYTQINGIDHRGRQMSDTEIFMQIGENNFAKRIAGYLGWRQNPAEYVQHALDDTDILNQFAGPRH